MLQCVAVCCDVLRFVAVFVFCSVGFDWVHLHLVLTPVCARVCESVQQCVAVCCGAVRFVCVAVRGFQLGSPALGVDTCVYQGV